MSEAITVGRDSASRMSRWQILRASFLRGGVVFGVTNGLVLFLLLLVVDFTSPLHPRFISLGDTDIFRLAGKVWATGGLPYVDYWDHKGPLIFFTNMLGYLLTGNENGVFWIDAVLLLVSMYFIWKLVGEVLGERRLLVRILTLWATILWFVIFMYPALDMTETVCLPFLAAGVWLGVRDARRLDARGGSVSWVTALVLGLGFSAGLLTRLTNALMVCVFALVLAVALALRGLWADLGRCVLGFLGGVLVLTVPFVAYFAAHGALYDMVYGTLIYNMEYAANVDGGNDVRLISMLFSRTAAEMLVVPVLLAVLSLASFAVSRSADVLRVMLLLTGVLLVALLLVSEPFPHYASVCVVLWPCVFWLVSRVFRWRPVVAAFLVLVLAYGGAWTVSQYRHAHVFPVFGSATVARVASRSDSVALYNVSAMAYLRYGVDPVYPLADLQDWQASFSGDYRDWLLDLYGKGDAEYILVPKTDGSEPVIQPVLDSRYELVEKGDDGILVYRLAGFPSSEGGDSR